ncbi:hypothetical protein [Chlamydia psittaci]|nr:hypothetical protein [Chlamydia psittaci]EPJ25776.1 hypothetical protein CP09DC77_0085 [Chlamydia psittaci 09DC77]EPJ30765.1 hypothetical protein CP09DC78_0084 [Chlamydia psittaci 09DC78]AFS22044.1 hypothetical protein B599_0755 [Chlamydia psittaci MN]AFS27201.1 hypothetical protein B711_0811 [Chlamydia psittaci CP3]EPJ27246.1 hypothetical protein CP09DC80_0084 [Chlamydia psittaci 09DC80]
MNTWYFLEARNKPHDMTLGELLGNGITMHSWAGIIIGMIVNDS